MTKIDNKMTKKDNTMTKIDKQRTKINKDKNRTKAITGSPQLTTLQYSPGHPWINRRRNLRIHELFLNNSKTF
jgi:hypothetical protein